MDVPQTSGNQRRRKDDNHKAMPVDYFAYHEKRRDLNVPWLPFDYHRSSSSSSSGSGKQLVRPPGTHGNSPKLAPLRIHPASFYGRLERHRWERERRIANGGGREDDPRLRHHYYHNYPRLHHQREGCRDCYTHMHMPSPAPSPLSHVGPTFAIGPPSSNESYRAKKQSHKRSTLSLESSASSSRYFSHPLTSTLFLQQLQPTLITHRKEEDNWRIPRLTSEWCQHRDINEGSNCTKCQYKQEDKDNSSLCSSENPPPTFTLEKYQPNRQKKTSRCSCSAVFVATTLFSILVLLLIAAFILYIEMVLKHKEYIPEPM